MLQCFLVEQEKRDFLIMKVRFLESFQLLLVFPCKQIIHANVTIVWDVTTYSLVILHRFLPRVFFLYFEDGSSSEMLVKMTSHPSRQSS
jgi:hypothetical protein